TVATTAANSSADKNCQRGLPDGRKKSAHRWSLGGGGLAGSFDALHPRRRVVAAFARLLQRVLLHAIPEASQRHAEELRRLRAHATRPLERLQDESALE